LHGRFDLFLSYCPAEQCKSGSISALIVSSDHFHTAPVLKKNRTKSLDKQRGGGWVSISFEIPALVGVSTGRGGESQAKSALLGPGFVVSWSFEVIDSAAVTLMYA
jgi:hypothetical protein